jgi:c-di-GMP-binding flagellar brake protein YcgR
VLAQFQMLYRTAKEDFRPAKAGNVSSGGLLMTCAEALVEGMPVELRFTLPSDVLKVYPEETLAIDVRNATVKSSHSDPRRSFEEMVVGARVVTHQPVGNGTYRYGLAFTSIDGYQQEEIHRYTHAAQRSKNRRQ